MVIGIINNTITASNSQLGPTDNGSGKARYTPAAANMATNAGQRGSRRTWRLIRVEVKRRGNSLIQLSASHTRPPTRLVGILSYSRRPQKRIGCKLDGYAFQETRTLDGAPMSSPPPTLEREQRKSGLALGMLVGAAAALLVLGLGVWFSTGVGLLRLLGLSGGGALISVNQPAVVRQIQQLQRLETVNYTMDKIISGERDNPYLPKFLAGDRLLLVVHGEVIGGIDLAKIQPRDVSVNGRSVSLGLPADEIFSTRIDNAKTRVYSRDTGLFTSPD